MVLNRISFEASCCHLCTPSPPHLGTQHTHSPNAHCCRLTVLLGGASLLLACCFARSFLFPPTISSYLPYSNTYWLLQLSQSFSISHCFTTQIWDCAHLSQHPKLYCFTEASRRMLCMSRASSGLSPQIFILHALAVPSRENNGFIPPEKPVIIMQTNPLIAFLASCPLRDAKDI